MSGADNVVINTRERPVSSDINDAQSMVHRQMLDAMQSMFETRALSTGGGQVPTGAPLDVVLGGLEVTPSGNDVQVQPGTLVQDSAVLVPVPGSLDSSYRIAQIRSAEVVTMPAPGAETWYVLEAQMLEVVTLNESRDVLNAATGVFVPTLVDKQVERRLSFQLVAGGAQAPAPSGSGWVPLAVIRRPAGGGAVAATDIIDIRRMWSEELALDNVVMSAVPAFSGRMADAKLETASVPNARTNLVDVQEQIHQPRSMFVASAAAVDLTAAAIIDPGVALAGDTWYYLYLVPWKGFAPFNANRVAALASKGVLVLSDVPPSANTLQNSGSIAMPTPWNDTAVLASTAYFIGAVRRNTTNTAWLWTQRTSGGWYEHELITVVSASPPADPFSFNLAGFVPSGVRAVRIRVNWTGDTVGPGSAGQSLALVPSGASLSTFYDIITADWNISGSAEFEVPLSKGTSFDLRVTGATRPATMSVNASAYLL